MSDGMTIAKAHIPAMPALPGTVCPSCNASAPSSANFCPNCGRRFKPAFPATSASRQIIIYLISFFVAPFGLWYAWKYLKQDDKKSKQIGIMAVVLTIVSLAFTIWTVAKLFNSVNQLLNPLSGLGL